ncbi:defensin-like peptide family protein [Acinetobacter baumannii 532279]|nr:defensin-like peptide family protein [Acinetobacter baumannii 532279]
MQAFLNGVCRHELTSVKLSLLAFFLNGVCRHEPYTINFS